MKTQRFQIEVRESTLEDLKKRLQLTRWPDSTAEGWEHGTHLPYLQELVQYWQTQFDWKKQEERLNSVKHYRAEIDGANIHFIHHRSPNKNATPMILTHGWPGSFVEMLGLLPLLQNDFHLVIPSLPGYGFSDRPKRPGTNSRSIAATWAKLMEGLGYSRYIAQGGDWGASVSTWLARDFPERLCALHLNYIPGSYKPFVKPDQPLTDAEKSFQQSQEAWFRDEGAYGHIQSTRPQTLAFSLNDSPVGLAAWILEKIRAWSDCAGDVEKRFSKDELLTNIQIYWITQTIHSSMRLYFEGKQMPVVFAENEQVTVPTYIAHFPGEAPMPPREWVERAYNVVRWNKMSAGAHFAAWEEPQLLANDLLTVKRI